MIRVCCACKARLGAKPPYEDTSETHTYCDECYEAQVRARFNRHLEAQSKAFGDIYEALGMKPLRALWEV